MWKLLLNRLIFLVPTLFIVLCIAFLLNLAAPGDQVLANLNLEGVSVSYSHQDYKNAYRRVARVMKKDRPPFYFSIKAHYLPDSLHGIVPKSYRQSLLSTTHQTGEWSVVERYHTTLQSALNLGYREQVASGPVFLQLVELEQTRGIENIKAQARLLAGAISESTDPALKARVDVLIGSIERLQPGRSFLTYPAITWNGRNCRFHYWMGRVFGEQRSLMDGSPVVPKLIRALRWTLSLTLLTLLISAVLSLVIAYYQTRFHGSPGDRISGYAFYLFYAIPLFWLATMGVVFLTTDEYGSWTDIFPSVGIMYTAEGQSFFSQLAENSKQLILPVLCLCLHSMAYLTRQIKTSLLAAKSAFYVQVARAKGLSEEQVLRRHALPNALLPYITILTAALPNALTGSLVIEVIFNIPGMGKLMLDSIRTFDWPVTFTILILVGIVTVLAYLLADVLYLIFYPSMARGLIDE